MRPRLERARGPRAVLGTKAAAAVVASVATAAMGVAAVPASAQAGPSGPTSPSWVSAQSRDVGSGYGCYSTTPPAASSATLSIVAGTNRSVSPGPAIGADIVAQDVATDTAGDVYIADPAHDVVEKVTPSGQLSVVAGVVDQCGRHLPKRLPTILEPNFSANSQGEGRVNRCSTRCREGELIRC